MRSLKAKRLVCCSHDREESDDFSFKADERVMTYNGLECLIFNSNFQDNLCMAKDDDYVSDFMEEDSTSCSSSNTSDGFSSPWKIRGDNHVADEWGVLESSSNVYGKQKSSYIIQHCDVEVMKEKFAKLLLGEDITGGSKGMSTALALSKAISNLSVSIFGEMWKVEPLPEESKRKWCMEMDWLLSPAHHMVELVSSKQEAANGRALEIMVSRTRADINVYLPALQTLDSMLLDAINSALNPLDSRKKILSLGKMVYQILKASRSINQTVLHEMPVPTLLAGAFPRSAKTSIGETLYKSLASDSCLDDIINSLELGNGSNDHAVLEIVNKLESAICSWREKVRRRAQTKSWPFKKDPAGLLRRAEALLHLIKHRYPNLPRSFLEASKVQYGKDVGHSILEAYSRVLGNVAFKVLSRIGELFRGEPASSGQMELYERGLAICEG